jgi:hypothetical protein
MGFPIRMLVWIPAFTYAGLVLPGNRTSPAQIATVAFFGASCGFLTACLFTIRQSRRNRLR